MATQKQIKARKENWKRFLFLGMLTQVKNILNEETNPRMKFLFNLLSRLLTIILLTAEGKAHSWTQGNGKAVTIDKIEKDHLYNIIKYIQQGRLANSNKIEDYYYLFLFEGEKIRRGLL